MKVKIIAIGAAFLLASLLAVAQNDSDGNELSVWGGYSPDSTTILGQTPDAKFGLVAFRYARRLVQNDTIKIRYTIDVIPMSFLSYPDFDVTGTPPIVRTIRPIRYAWGASPIGLQFSIRPSKKVQPYVDGSGGMLIYSTPTPNFGGTKFNFTFDVGGGIEVKTGGKRSISFGYKYFHISNGFRGTNNPGFDNNLFYIGYKFHSW